MNISDRTARDKLLHVLEVITGFRLCKPDITMSINLVTAIGIVLSRLNLTSDRDRKHSLQELLYNFSDVDSFTRQLTTLVIEYIQQSETKIRDRQLLLIGQALTKSEKILLLTYAYSVSKTNNYNAIEDIAGLLKIEALVNV